MANGNDMVMYLLYNSTTCLCTSHRWYRTVHFSLCRVFAVKLAPVQVGRLWMEPDAANIDGIRCSVIRKLSTALKVNMGLNTLPEIIDIPSLFIWKLEKAAYFIWLAWGQRKKKWIMNSSFSVNDTLTPGNPDTKSMRGTNVSVTYHIPVIEQQKKVLISVQHPPRPHTRETSEPKQSKSLIPPRSTLDFHMPLRHPTD